MRLHGITAHQVETGQPKTAVRIFYGRPGDVTQDIGFSAASCAWAGAAKKRKIEIRFGAVVPLNGKFVSDLLNVGWFQAHGLSMLTGPRREEQSLNQIL